jgi:2-dehydro-3-deoxyphosphooctonate aldolase (KDO 8-P synthase)
MAGVSDEWFPGGVKGDRRRGLILVAGPCVIESRDTTLFIAERLAGITEDLPVRLLFKASYLKANRSHPDSYAGPGLEKGLEILGEVKAKTGLPLLSDVHCRTEVQAASDVLDVLQIPAYLCRQTPLIREAARSGRVVNIKKGQFMAPDDMRGAVKKVTGEGNERVMLTERGTFFGYHNLVVDFRSIEIMRRWGHPVLFDGTHSIQRPGAGGKVSGGEPEFISPLCRAAASVGVDGLYLEVHPNPGEALSDAASMLPLDALPRLLEEVLSIREATSGVNDRSG